MAKRSLATKSASRTTKNIAVDAGKSKQKKQKEMEVPFDANKAQAEEARRQAMDKKRKRLQRTTGSPAQKDDPEWKFFDTARLHVSGGDGGNGCVAFRREKGEPMGGPSGGRGGRGGSIYLVCDDTLNTLAPVRNKVHVRAGQTARNGIGKNKNGPAGKDNVVYVPPGTVVRELHTQKVAGELREHGETLLVARGGRGGRGNAAFKNPNYTAPRIAERGKNKNGPAGKDNVVYVPPGTVVRELHTQKVAGELREHGETLLVARGGRGGRGNAAFKNPNYTAPRIAERGEPGAKRWLALELRLVADVGFLGMPNAGKSTLLSAASAARPKIADYPFTTIVPNLGVCDIGDEGAGLVLCDIPGLIEGAAGGAGMGPAFLRHVQRCKVLLHVVDGTSEDPIGDFITINKELKAYDEFLAKKPQVVVLNKIDVSEVQEKSEELIEKLKEVAGHSRVLSISAATTERVKELMGRLKKFAEAQPDEDLPALPEIDFTKAGLDFDSDDYEIISDPAYPGQWRISGSYIEQVAKMTHWEYPEAVERFGRQLEALGIAAELERRGGVDGDLVMVGEYDFDFAPGLTNPYIPPELLEQDAMYEEDESGERRAILVDEPDSEADRPWRPFSKGGYMDVDTDELIGFDEDGEWDLLDDDTFDGENFEYDDDEVWMS